VGHALDRIRIFLLTYVVGHALLHVMSLSLVACLAIVFSPPMYPTWVNHRKHLGRDIGFECIEMCILGSLALPGVSWRLLAAGPSTLTPDCDLRPKTLTASCRLGMRLTPSTSQLLILRRSRSSETHSVLRRRFRNFRWACGGRTHQARIRNRVYRSVFAPTLEVGIGDGVYDS
jgi:hypothetical protein